MKEGQNDKKHGFVRPVIRTEIKISRFCPTSKTDRQDKKSVLSVVNFGQTDKKHGFVLLSKLDKLNIFFGFVWSKLDRQNSPLRGEFGCPCPGRHGKKDAKGL